MDLGPENFVRQIFLELGSVVVQNGLQLLLGEFLGVGHGGLDDFGLAFHKFFTLCEIEFSVVSRKCLKKLANFNIIGIKLKMKISCEIFLLTFNVHSEFFVQRLSARWSDTAVEASLLISS